MRFTTLIFQPIRYGNNNPSAIWYYKSSYPLVYTQYECRLHTINLPAIVALIMRHNFAGLSRSYILFQRWTRIAKNLRTQHHQVRNLKIWNQRPKPTARSMNRKQPPQRITVQELLTKYHLKLDPSHNTTFSKLQDLALKIVETLTICLIIHKTTESEGIITIPLLHNSWMQWFLLRPQNIFGMCLRLSLHI